MHGHRAHRHRAHTLNTHVIVGISACTLLSLCTTALGAGFPDGCRTLQHRGSAINARLGREERRTDPQGDKKWWWGGRGALRRAGGGCGYRGCLRSSGFVGAENGSGKIGSRVPVRAGAGNGVGKLSPEGLEAVARKLARYRAGAGGGHKYDDDYYGGPGGEDPYYEDAGGWGDDGGGGDGGHGGRYDPYDDRAPPRRGRGPSAAGFDLTGTITRGNKKYGVYALAGSVLLTMMGVSLMFEKNLIRLGNLGFVAGMALFIGPSNVVRYFSQASKLRGSIIFAIGFFFVFTGHPIIGLAIEFFGFLNLFGNMLPMFWAMASNMPVVKDIIGSDAAAKRKKAAKKQKRPSRQAPPPYYDDGYGYEGDDDWDNGGGGGGRGDWGYDDHDPYRR